MHDATVVGDQLGLYKVLAEGPATAEDFICTPVSRSQEVGMCLGAQAGEARLRDVVAQGGFTRFRRTCETPFNLIFEARP